MTSLAISPFDGMDIRTLLDRVIEERSAHPFLIWEPFDVPGRVWTYAEFGEQVRRFAAGLCARGVAPGDRILVHLDNCPEAIIAWFGCGYAGAVAVTTNARSSPGEIGYFARHSGAIGAVTQPLFADAVAEAAPDLAWRVVTSHDNGAPPAAFSAAYEPFASIDATPESGPRRPANPMAPFGIQYTSGTTARPKAVIWTHANALWGAQRSAEHEALGPDDVHLVYLPLYHTNAQCYSLLATLWVGGTVVLMPKFSASRFWPVSVKHHATWTSMAPFCSKALLEHPRPERHDYRFWGNGVCSPPWDSDFGVKTIGWWGMTETVTHGIVGSVRQPNTPMSVGRPAPGYEIFVLDEYDQPVAPGETGDLFVRGERGVSLFLEYAGDPEATRKAFRPDGLFITGDRVRRGEDGCLYFVDRSKDMLRVGSENVSASEIESVIASVEGVSEAAVIAAPHPMLDEIPIAFVIPRASVDTEALREAILAACHRNLASFKQPREIRFLDALPRSTLEKVAKAQLRASYLASLPQT